MQDPKFCKRSDKIKQENLEMMRLSALGTNEINTSLFDYLENQNIQISDSAIEPSVGYYFDGIYYQMDPTNEVEEEDKFKSSQIYVWRALRVLARNDLNPIRMEQPDNQFEFHLEEICNKMRKEHNKITKQDINKDVMDLRKMKEKVQADKKLQEAKEAEEAAKKAEVIERERNERKKIELQEKIKEKEQQQSEKEQGEIKPDKLRKLEKHSKGHSKEHIEKKFENKSKARKSEDKKYERKHQGMGHKRSPIHSSIPGERKGHSQKVSSYCLNYFKRVHLN